MYSDYSDEKLLKLFKQNDRRAGEEILNRYKGLVRNRARKFFLAGGDTEDLVQEGMIGLYKAIDGYDQDKNTAFFTFAYNCINKKILNAVKGASRLKHMPLNLAVTLYEKDDAKELIKSLSPEDIAIEKEDIEELNDWLTKILSGFEKEVLNLYLDGLSYMQMSEKLNKSAKAIDNAITRAKNKIRKSLK